ncbi:DUF4167 domain-containing protein [Microvirga sp. W0021]|uniref:DUF4167 domain-containing protein n=1 Tax=Hohaiivirga grylli TaxID=3133970 RepID=A0ABV0BL68_9HYPH
MSMRLGQNRRMRGRSRNNSKGPNPLTRSYESNGPDVKIRGTAQHIAEKYSQLSRDAQAAGDPIAAENYLQHAEHYFRIIAASQEQMRQQYGQYQRSSDDEHEEGDGESEENGHYNPETDEQPTIDGSDFVPSQSANYENHDSRRDQQRPQRRSRYGRIDRNRTSNSDHQRYDQEGIGEGNSEGAPSRNRYGRQEFNEERPVRRRTPRTEGVEENNEAQSSLPAFLTNPVRQSAKAEEPEMSFSEPPENDEEAKPVRRRRRVVRSVETDAGAE